MKKEIIMQKMKHKHLYRTNNKMYGLLLLIIVLLVGVVAFVLKRIQNSDFDIVLSIVTGLLSGLLASVITAWIIDISTCKQKNATSKNEADKDLSALKMWLDELFQEMRNQISLQSPNDHMTFESIFNSFVEQHKADGDHEVLEKSFVGIYVYSNLIVSTIDKLTTGEEKEYLFTIYGDAYSFLVLANSITDLRENLFNNGNANYDYIYSGIYDFLSTVIRYADLLLKEYRATQIHVQRNN